MRPAGGIASRPPPTRDTHTETYIYIYIYENIYAWTRTMDESRGRR